MAFPSSDPFGGAPRPNGRSVHSHTQETDPHPQYATDDDVAATDASVAALDARLDNAEAAWTAYTPAWTASTTNPVLNNGTLLGFYRQVGKTVTLRVQLTVGSTTTIGSGNYSISLPVSARTSTRQLVLAQLQNAAGSSVWIGSGRIDSGASTITRTAFQNSATTTEVWRSAGPLVMTTGDLAYWSGTYEAA